MVVTCHPIDQASLAFSPYSQLFHILPGSYAFPVSMYQNSVPSIVAVECMLCLLCVLRNDTSAHTVRAALLPLRRTI